MRILDTFRPAGANVRGAMNCATTNTVFVNEKSSFRNVFIRLSHLQPFFNTFFSDHELPNLHKKYLIPI